MITWSQESMCLTGLRLKTKASQLWITKEPKWQVNCELAQCLACFLNLDYQSLKVIIWYRVIMIRWTKIHSLDLLQSPQVHAFTLNKQDQDFADKSAQQPFFFFFFLKMVCTDPHIHLAKPTAMNNTLRHRTSTASGIYAVILTKLFFFFFPKSCGILTCPYFVAGRV